MATVAEAVELLTLEYRTVGAEQAKTAAKGVASAVDGVTEAQRRSERATQSMERRLASIERQYDEAARAQQAMARVERDLAMAQSQGLITLQRRGELLSMAAEKHGLATAAINREVAATERLATVQRMQSAANSNSMYRGASAFNVANIGAQFQDIGVTAAMGMSPMQIALQQGTQLSAVLGPMGAAGAARALGASLLSLVNPVSLITIGLTGAAALAIQYFMSWDDSAQDSEKVLREQADLIARVAQRWGGALPALKAYNDELERGREAAERAAAQEAAIEQQYADARKELPSHLSGVADLTAMVPQGSESSLVRIQQLYATLEERVRSNTATAEDAAVVQGALNDLFSETRIKGVKEMADAFGAYSASLEQTAQKAAKLRDEQSGLIGLDPLGGFTDPPPVLTQEAMLTEQWQREREERMKPVLDSSGRIPFPRLRGVDDVPDAAKQSEYLRSQQDSIEMLQLEIGLVGQSEQARQRQIAVLETEQEIRRRGIDLYGAEAEAMRANSARQIELSQRLADLKRQEGEAQAANKRIYEDTLGYAEDQLQKLIQGTFTWRDALSSLIPVLFDILGELGNGKGGSFLDKLGNLFGGSGGNSAPFSANTTLSSLLGGGETSGAPVGAVTRSPLAAIGGGAFNTVGNYRAGVDDKLTDILKTAAEMSGRRVDAFSGFRPGDTRFHGKALATDIRLFDNDNNPLANYQNAGAFREYEKFAQTARAVQMEKYPELANKFRWGGYFGGEKGKYGAMDTMHFDLGGKNMAGGSWESGLFDKQRALFPGVESVGMGKASAALDKLTTSATGTAQSLAGGLGSLGNSLQQVATSGGGGAAGGGLLGWLFGGLNSAFSGTRAFNWMSANPGGYIGLFANGGVTDRPSIFGEAGPEAAVPLPDGRRIPVEMRDNRPRVAVQTGSIADVRVFVDRDGNWQAAVERISQGVASPVAKQAAAGAVGAYAYQQRQGGAAADDHRYKRLKRQG